MGLIFDMDGVLVDSNAAHFASWRKIASEDGVDFPEEVFWRTFGMTSEYIVEHYWRGGSSMTTEEIARIVERKETAFRESVKDCVKPIKGSVEFVRWLASRGVKLAAGSSAPRVNVEYVLDWLQIRDYFGDRVVAGDEVKNGKPSPDIFLAAAKKMGESAENCVVIDDSRSGVTAGRRAGAKVIGLFSGGHAEDEYENADVVARSFDEVRKILTVDSEGNVDFAV